MNNITKNPETQNIKHRAKLNIKHNKKFNNTRNTIKTNQLKINTDNWFKNLIDKNIPMNVIETVALGQKFNPPFELNDHLVVKGRGYRRGLLFLFFREFLFLFKYIQI